MALCFIHLIEAAALILNAMGILNERRVLRPLGLDKPNSTSNIKNQLSLLFHSYKWSMKKRELASTSKANPGSVEEADHVPGYNSSTTKNEIWIIHKVLSLISGYDARPLFVPLVSGKRASLGVFPEIITVSPSVNSPHVSPSAIRSLLLHISRLGSAIHLLFKLENALNTTDDLSQASINRKPFPHTLNILISNYGNEFKGEPKGTNYDIAYDWNWNEDFGGFCSVLKMLLDDWRFIMFDIQKNYFKKLKKEFGETNGDKNNVITNKFMPERKYDADSLKSPLMDLYDFNLFRSEDDSNNEKIESENVGVYHLCIKLMSYMPIFGSLANLMELFLNSMALKEYRKSDMCNVMINLLLLLLRDSEASKNKNCTNLYKFLLFNTMKNSKGSISNYLGSSIFKSFNGSIEKMMKITNTIDIINPTKNRNETHWPQHLYLPENLASLCSYDVEHTELKLLERLDFQFQLNIKVGSNFIKNILDGKFYFNHYLYVLNGIVSLQFGDFAESLTEHLRSGSCGIQEHEQTTEILYSAISDWIKHNSFCTLSGISISTLSEIISSLHFEMEPQITNSRGYIQHITIKIVKDGPITMFLTTESMKMYSDIFMHFIRYTNFKNDVYCILLKSKALSDEMFRKYLCKVSLLLIHLIHCFSTYFSWVINKSWNMIHDIEYGISIEEMRMKHRNYLLFLTQALFIPVDCTDPIYTLCRLNELVTNPITEIFNIPQMVLSVLESGNDIDDIRIVYENLANSVNVLKGVFESRITDSILDLGNYHPLNNDSRSDTDAKPSICNIVAIFRNLLCFNDRENARVLSF
ncbi:hypothetical protein BEWA_042660 [Theileria equi strain WA]|uniref:Gamma tubulin complex component C-terminal domain-containing protein n=1 Tax=Theileria equi strain WA TaxID=1537102 RepID=L1LGG1_THEEQ|nr:hypothetical protein BEWA_042660 [Theileria equi strain WA]EKX74228.1 hypothetical protein BEWA_042660 [Theileria equi strain WA]|eukprot:XP_004833680.1 hypothetical protein BEWA_042660 [Theileria equi strain WA]